MKRVSLILLSSVLVISIVMLFSFPAVSSAGKMEQAQKLFDQRADLEKGKKGVALLQDILKDDPKNEKAHELLCRLSVFVGMDLGADKATQMESYEYLGISSEAADAWLKVSPNSGPANFWKAYAAAASKDIKTALSYCEKAIKISPNYMSGMPNLVMGYLKGLLPAFLGGDKVAGYKYLDKAMEAAPDNLMIHRIKAFLLINDIKSASQKAMVHLQFVIEGEPSKGMEPEARRDKKIANDLMKKYGEALKGFSK